MTRGTRRPFTVTTPPVPPDHWKAEYFGTQELSGAPVATVDEGTGFVDHSWGTGGPAGLADHFSARFTRTVTLAAGRYRFTVTTDDGSRLWVNEQLRINEWWAQGPTPYTVEIDLDAGTHTLRYEYFEQTGGATAQLTWTLLTPVVLASGEALWENQSRVSLDGAYRLQYQGDGNLVVVRLTDDTCAWSSQTNGTSVWVTVMQGDGNLVVYDGDGVPVWNAGTAGHDGARLEIANHTMAIISPDGTTRWAVSLAAEPARPAIVAASRPGAAALLALVIALGGFAVMGLRRRLRAPEPRRARRAVVQLPVTALLLTAMLLVPATALAQIPTQQVEYYHTDALGSVRAVTKQVNGQWQVVARHDFMPFGEEVAPPSQPQEKRLFTGKERDNETGLDYFEARHLRTSVARFTTVDPGQVGGNVVDPQSWNAYGYARNNPLRYVDPDGLEYEICVYGASGYGYVSDQYFEGYLAFSPGPGIRLEAGWIYVSGRREPVGWYRQISKDATFASVILDAGHLADAGLEAGAVLMAGAATVGATGGLAAGMLSGGVAVSPPFLLPMGGRMAAAMSAVQNPALRRALDDIYRWQDKIAGGLGGAVRYTQQTGRLVGGSDHLGKLTNSIGRLENILRNQMLSPSERELARSVLEHLKVLQR